jgi:predicted nucleic acid-binding protein
VIVVLDASVIIKWLLADPEREEHTDKAQNLMLRIIENEIQVFQPVHWLAEVGAVLSRLSPQTVTDDARIIYIRITHC